MIRLSIFLVSCVGLTACFNFSTPSRATLQSGKLGAEVSIKDETSGKASVIISDTHQNLTIKADAKSELAGTSVAISSGSLSLPTSLVIERGVELGETSIRSEVGLTDDIKVEAATAGVIIRPKDNVELKNPLTISLPLPNITGFRLAGSKIAIFYKYIELDTQRLVTGLIPVDGVRASIVFDSVTQKDTISFQGYFGSYWVVQLSREPLPAEIPPAKVSLEPIVNQSRTPVIASSGVITEKTIVAAQVVPVVVLAKPTLSFDGNSRTLTAEIAVEKRIKSCLVDFVFDGNDLNGKTLDAASSSKVSFAVAQTQAHTRLARFRCVDEGGRSTISPWSDAVNIPVYNFVRVTKVTSSLANGIYKAGAVIPVDVVLTSQGSVTGSPYLVLDFMGVERVAEFKSVVDGSTLHFEYLVQDGDLTDDVTYKNASSLSAGKGQILDEKGVAVDLTLPALDSALSLNSLKDIAVDAVIPAPVFSIGFQTAATTAPSFPVSWAFANDSSVNKFAVKLCEHSDCATNCTASSLATSSPFNVSAPAGSNYLACVQSQDRAGNTSPWVSSVGAIAVSAPLPQFPIVMSVTSSLANGFYKTGQSVPLLVTFSEPVFVTNPGDLQLKVETGSTDQTAIYMSGSGTTALLFLYTVQPGDISSDLDLVSVNPLTLNTALIKDVDGINANLTFVAPGAAGSLSAARAIVIDTIPPIAPGSPTFPSAFTNVSSPSISWTASTDVNFQLYEKKACSSSDCATNCGTAYTTTGLSSTLAGALSPTYYGCIRSKDLASNYSNWVPTANSITLDQTAPTVTNVTSNMADGLYTSGQIEVLMTMSEPVFATNIASINIGMLLVNGTRPIYATSIVSSTILRFLYTIQPGDNTPDLNYCTNCISLGSSTLKDAAGNNANIVLPAIGSASSLGSQKAIAIDAAPPIFTGITNLWRKSETEAQFFWEAARDTTTPTYDIVYEVCQSTTLGSCAASFAVTAVMPQNTFEYTATALTPGVVYEFAVRARDLAGNTTIGTQVQTNKGLSNVTKLRSGTGHSCALLTDGTVKCWGSTYSALLRTPATVAGLSNVVDIALGNLFTCAKLSDQTVKCWGSNTSGQLGDGTITSSAIPVTVLGLTGVQSIAAGTTHACALLADQTVKCWGFNGVGQLGDGTTTTSSSPVLATLTGVTKISLGGSNSCAILTGGSVKCWGSNSYGQIGDGTTTTRITPTTATSVTTAVSVELGTIHACALLSNQTVKCWGANTYGNLGDGTTTNRTTAIVVPSLTAITAISVGDSHTCAVNTASTAKCWGINTYGQLGNGTRTNSLSPVDVTDLTNVADLSLTGTNSCALLNNSTVKCWGNGLSGQNGSFANNLIALMPVAIPGLPTLSKLALGEMHTCALLSDGSVSCWGVNNEGQVGSTELNRSTPYPVPGISNVIQLEAGQRHTCALLADQTIRCWGAGVYGELGNGILASNPAPQTVLNISNAVKIYAGLMHTCALLATGTVKCWGQNNQGQLGDGTTTNNSSAVAVTGLSSVADLSLGEVSTCARLTDKTVRCWGSNAYGQFGDGTIVDSLIPVPSLAMGVEKLESGNRHSCAILSDSTVKCWGFNGYYQAGQTVNTPVLTPAPVPTIQNALSVALGAFTSCALLSDQTVKCWGDNAYRQFGVSTSNGPNPIAIGLKGVASLSLGSFHACAILTDNSARCWGRNDPGMIAKEVFESITTTPRIVAP